MIDREKDIADSLTNESMSAVELAKKYAISRERVYKIYSKTTGFERGTLRAVKKHNKENKIKFICSGCSLPVTVKEGRYLHKYCRSCHNISQDEHRILSLKFICDNCGKEYHPLAISVRKSRNAFCSSSCYMEQRRRGKKVGA